MWEMAGGSLNAHFIGVKYFNLIYEYIDVANSQVLIRDGISSGNT